MAQAGKRLNVMLLPATYELLRKAAGTDAKIFGYHQNVGYTNPVAIEITGEEALQDFKGVISPPNTWFVGFYAE